MSNGKTVRLKVVDEEGVAIQGAFVYVLRSTVAFPEIALVTDANGIVRLSFPKGKFVIGADAGERHGELELDSSESSPETVVLTLLRTH